MPGKEGITTKNVRYWCPHNLKQSQSTESVQPLGFDTEALTTGEPFMLATSEGDVYKLRDFPACMFTRQYRNRTFVTYNLRYDEGAIIYNLPKEALQTFRRTNTVEHDGYVYKSIPRKMISIRKGKNAVTFFDLASFFGVSLNRAAQSFLGKKKLDMPTMDFTPEYVESNWRMIADYCIQDSVLVRELAETLIQRFEAFGVYPRKLFSTAYISYQYFSRTTDYVRVRDLWDNDRDVLDMAMLAYSGGKFEVTEKGKDHYYEYDINSAYPNEIANLIDIRKARISREPTYHPKATYGFIDCTLDLPAGLCSPVAVKRGSVNTFPTGRFDKVITKTEYDWLLAHGATAKINKAVWLTATRKTKPYEKEIRRLYAEKQRAKVEKRTVDYHVLKVFLNSLYGKFVQLIREDGYWKASSCWNPIYGAIITANVRVRITDAQERHTSVVAVHTDSVITTAPLDFPESDALGDFSPTIEGDGVILGSGIYQIGNKTRFRGFDTKIDLLTLLGTKSNKAVVTARRPRSWREIVFLGWDSTRINRFETIDKNIDINFDSKRLWLDDWETFADVNDFKVPSVPLQVSEYFGYPVKPRKCEHCNRMTQLYIIVPYAAPKRRKAEGWVGGTYVEHKGIPKMGKIRKVLLCADCYQVS